MTDPDPNIPHPFHRGPTGRCTYGTAFPCGRGRDADIHEGEVAVITDRGPTEVHAAEDRPIPTPPGHDVAALQAPSRRPTWAELPIPSRVVITATSAGVAAVFVCACVALCAVLLRAGGVIG